MVTVGRLVTLQAKPGKEDEPETTAWFTIKIDDSTFAIADFFPAAAPGTGNHGDGCEPAAAWGWFGRWS